MDSAVRPSLPSKSPWTSMQGAEAWPPITHHNRSGRETCLAPSPSLSSSSALSTAVVIEKGGAPPAVGRLVLPCHPYVSEDGEKNSNGEEEGGDSLHSPTVSTTSFAWDTPLQLHTLRGDPPGCNSTISGGSMAMTTAVATASVRADGSFSNKVLSRVKEWDSSSIPKGEAGDVCFVLKGILQRVCALHLSRCPLCAPPPHPAWWKTLQVEKRCREERDNVHNTNGNGSMYWQRRRGRRKKQGDHTAPQFIVLPSLSSSSSAMCMEKSVNVDSKQVQHQWKLLRAEATNFLDHVYSRRMGLTATQSPARAASSDVHPLQQQCAALGGVVLLETLLLGL